MRHVIDASGFDGEHAVRLAAHHARGVNKTLEARVLVRDGMASVVFRVVSRREEIISTADLGSAVNAYNESD